MGRASIFCLKRSIPRWEKMYWQAVLNSLAKVVKSLKKKIVDHRQGNLGNSLVNRNRSENKTWRPYNLIHTSESESRSVVSDSLQPHGLYSPWNSPGQNTGEGSLFILQRIIPAQRPNPGLPYCRWLLYQLSQQASPRKLEWVAYPFSSRSSRPRNRTRVSCIAGGFFLRWAARNKTDRHLIPNSGRTSRLMVATTFAIIHQRAGTTGVWTKWHHRDRLWKGPKTQSPHSPKSGHPAIREPGTSQNGTIPPENKQLGNELVTSNPFYYWKVQ